MKTSKQFAIKQNGMREFAGRMAYTTGSNDTAIAGWIFFTTLFALALTGMICAGQTVAHHQWFISLVIGPVSFLYLCWCGLMLYFGVNSDRGNGSAVYQEALSAYYSLTPELQVHTAALMKELRQAEKNGVHLTPNDVRVTSLIDLSNHKLAVRGMEHVQTINRLINALDEVSEGTKEIEK